MIIDIQNFNSIKSLRYEIVDHKINFLFGISGSGKSSIATALTDSEINQYQMVGKNVGAVHVFVNGATVNYQNNSIYNSEFMENILLNKNDNSDIYTILIGTGGQISECSQKYESAIADLKTIEKDLLSTIHEIADLKETLKIDYNSNGSFKSTCLIRKMAKSADNTPKYKNVSSYSSSDIKWLVDGTKMLPYQNGKCPFCAKKLSSSRKEKIKELQAFDAKTFEKINAKKNTFDALKIKIPEWNKAKEVAAFSKKIEAYSNILAELNEYYAFLNIAKTKNFDDESLALPKPSVQLKHLFPKIYASVTAFNKKASEIKKALGVLKSETNKVLNENSKLINDKLNLLGIPYIFEREGLNSETKTASFILRHKDDLEADHDMSENLSNGEKNLIGLLLFLLSHNHFDLLVIDDPASSFDEYRRKIIFDFIYEFQNNATILVLSHDHVFAKLAAFHSETSKDSISKQQSVTKLDTMFANSTGKIDFLENYHNPIIKPIHFKDFDSITYFVSERIESLGHQMNYIVALNLRLYYELEKKHAYKRLIYEYLSAILHKTPYKTILEILDKKKKTEQEILEFIKKDTGILFNPLSEDYLVHIEEYEYCAFEKTIKKRGELPKTKKNKEIKEELNNIVHLNLAYATMLNPYKFNYFSKHVYELISKEDS